jgi:hypothetical protein
MADDEPGAGAGATGTTTVGDAAATDVGPDDERTEADAGSKDAGRDGDVFDLRGIVRQFTAPMIESLDARLREQVVAHADALLDEKVDAAVSDRLATIERAIADLSRTLDGIERRLSSLERADTPSDLE